MRCQSIRSITHFTVFLALTLTGSVGAFAQASQLRPCPKDKNVRWHNCQGTITFPKGEKYAGEFQNDKKHGYGTATYNAGDKYVGAFSDGRRNGHGTYTFANGNKYVGEFLNGNYHGQGTYTRSDGHKYVGDYRNDKKHGYGTSTYSDGDKYVGEYRDDQRNGHGTYTFANGNKYVGEFLNGNYHGQGTHTLSNGDKYVGAYREDEKNGHGTHTFANGNKYVGEFLNGNYHGQGTLYAADGTVSKSGIWADNEFVASLDKPETAVSAASAPSNSSIDALPTRRIALVIGNAKYAHASVLTNPINDAQALASMLWSVGLQTVMVKADLNREQTIAALRDFAKAADTADWAVVYYSGHGIEYNGVNYMVPVDAQLKVDRDIDLEAIDIGKVLGAIEGAKKLRLVLLDACRDNPFLRQTKRSIATRSLSQGLARIEPEAGTLIVYAAKHGETALDGVGQNSPFAEALLRRLRTPDLEVRRLFDVVRDDVMAATNKRQQPYSYGSLSGSENFSS
jgi:hypothetical protein